MRTHRKNRKRTAVQVALATLFPEMEFTPRFIRTDNEGSTHWVCVISNGGHTEHFEYFMGSGHTVKKTFPNGYIKTYTPDPTLDSVLWCLVSDSRIAEDYTLAEFGRELGYNNVGKCVETYNACKLTLEKIKALGVWCERDILDQIFMDY